MARGNSLDKNTFHFRIFHIISRALRRENRAGIPTSWEICENHEPQVRAKKSVWALITLGLGALREMQPMRINESGYCMPMNYFPNKFLNK